MVTFDQLVTRACDDLEAGLTDAPPDALAAKAKVLVERVVRSTVAALGLYISEKTGEVYNPAPKPVMNYPYDQRGVRWKGSRGRGR